MEKNEEPKSEKRQSETQKHHEDTENPQWTYRGMRTLKANEKARVGEKRQKRERKKILKI